MHILHGDNGSLIENNNCFRTLDLVDRVTENVQLHNSEEFKYVQTNIALVAAPTSTFGFNGLTLVTDIKPRDPLNQHSVSYKRIYL